MKKKLTARQIETRARAAQKLLENKVFNEAFEMVRESINDAIDALPPSDVEGLVFLKAHLHIARSYEANLKETIRTGQKQGIDTARADELPPLGDIVEWRRKRMKAS